MLILLIVGIALVAAAVITPLGSYFKDKFRGRKRSLKGYLIASLFFLVVGIVCIAVAVSKGI